MKKQLISWFLLIAIVLSFTGCAPESTDPTLSTEVPKENALTMDLLSALERQPVESQAPDRELADPMGAFALALLQNSHVPGENTVLFQTISGMAYSSPSLRHSFPGSAFREEADLD